MKILIAEDDPISRRLLQATLNRWGYEVEVACDGQEAWQMLERSDAASLAILDWMMPQLDGVELCRRIRQRIGGPYVYLILLTAKSQKEDLIEGMEAGADDYITKPFDVNELKVRVRAGRRILELEAALLATQETLRNQAMHDSLTGLWNHAAILDHLRQELCRSQRERIAMGIILGDLDDFKQVNDTYGHLVGDVVLRGVARRMREAVRSYDAIGRYGGEEFLIVVPGSERASTLKLGERLRQQVGGHPIETPSGMIAITMSLGVAASDGEPRADATAFVRAADEALYHAKAGGRNRVVLAESADGAGNGNAPSAGVIRMEGVAC